MYPDGLLLPALNRARKQANEVTCAANLRSIGQALTMYIQQYGYYPGCWATREGGGRGYAVWPVRLRPFTGGNQEVFYCPSQDERCMWVAGTPPANPADAADETHAAAGYDLGEPVLLKGDLSRQGSFFSYGYNGGGTGAGPRLSRGLGLLIKTAALQDPNWVGIETKASRVRKPAEMIAVADAHADGRWDLQIGPDLPISVPGTIHRGGANVLFCDGHVQWYLQKDLLNIQADGGPVAWAMNRMWNNDHRGGLGIPE